MATVLERVQVAVDSDALQAVLGDQVQALATAVDLVEQLRAGKVPGFAQLLSATSALRPPFADFDDGFAATLANAERLIPRDATSAIAPVLEQLGSLDELVVERLQPLLGDAVATAKALQHFVSLRLGCPPPDSGEPSPPGGGGGPPDPPPPGGPQPPPGRVGQAAQQLQQLENILAKVPPQVDAGGLLQLLALLAGSKPRDRFVRVHIPIFDDLVEPLQTLALWAARDVDGVRDHLRASLETLALRLGEPVRDRLAALTTTLASLRTRLDADTLALRVDGVVDGLSSVAAALTNADAAALAAARTAATNAVDDYEALRIALQPLLVELRDQSAAVRAMPSAALAELQHLTLLLEPSNFAAGVTRVVPALDAISAEAIAAAQQALEPVQTWLNELLEALNFAALQDGLAEVTQGASALAATVNDSLVAASLAVQAAFAEVASALATVDLAQFANGARAEVQAFGARTRRDLVAAWSPARAGFGQAVGALDTALTAFDPAALEDALRSVFDAISGVLGGADVQAAIAEVREAIDSITEALQALSFAPLTDEVIALIATMRKGVEAALAGEGGDTIAVALKEAMAFLPPSLEPATQPLLEDFAALVDAGPVQLLERVAAAPGQLVGQLRAFEPAALLGDTLQKPFAGVTAAMEKIDIASALLPVGQALDEAKRRILRSASPSAALGGLAAPLRALQTRLDAFTPSALLAPITAELEGAIERILAASPVDEVRAVVDGVFATVREVLGFVERVGGIATSLQSLCTALRESPAQLDAWHAGIRTKLTQAADASLVGPTAEINTLLTGLGHASVLGAYDGASGNLLLALDGLGGDTRSSRWVAEVGRVRTRLAAATALPSADRTALEALLARVDAVIPATLAPLRIAAELQDALINARASLVADETRWTESGAALDTLRIDAPAALVATVDAAITDALLPARWLLGSVGQLSAPVTAATETIAATVTTLTTRIGALVDGPAGLATIATALQTIVDALRGIDLGVIGRGLDTVVGTLRDQLRALDPTLLLADLDRELAALLDTLTLDVLLPSAELDQLQASLVTLRGRLAALDPTTLVNARLQPLFDDTVVPLLAAFDLSGPFTALLDFLKGLDAELRGELGRVDSAYQGLIALRGDGGSAGVSVGIGG